jgi:hypothetical protein
MEKLKPSNIPSSPIVAAGSGIVASRLLDVYERKWINTAGADARETIHSNNPSALIRSRIERAARGAW